MFGYLDKSGILHVVEAKSTATEYAKFNGKIVETTLGDGHGMLFENGKKIYVYAKEGKFYEGGNAENGSLMDVETFKQKYPESYKLYTELK